MKHPGVATTDFERQYVCARPGRTLVVGSHVYPGREDRRALFVDAVGWDMLAGEGVDRAIDLEEPLAEGDSALFDHVDCLSVLEHSKRPWALAANIERLLRSGGTLYLGVPFVWRIHGYPDDYWRFTPNGVRTLFPNIEWKVMRFQDSGLYSVDKGLVSLTVDDYPYFPRTLVCGFGVRK